MYKNNIILILRQKGFFSYGQILWFWLIFNVEIFDDAHWALSVSVKILRAEKKDFTIKFSGHV